MDTIVNGTQFIATVEKVNNYGSYEIKEPTCGTIRIVAKPNTYYVVVEYGSDATSVAPDITAITPADKQFDRWSEDITNVQGDMTVWPLWKDKTGINNVEAESQATKFMKNGQLFIRRGDKIFNATGAKVK